jgi:hypothetical protein
MLEVARGRQEMSEATEFAAGERCELHDIPFCADCQERLGLRRGIARSGEDANSFYFANDCAIASFREITGASYDEAVGAIGSGFSPRTGTKTEALKAAIESVGFRLVKQGLGKVTARGIRSSGLTIPEARAASLDGRVFLLVGSGREGAHAWTILDGQVNRPFLRAPYAYGILEVIA